MRRVRRGSVTSELLMCGAGVRSNLLLSLVARCLETIDVCIWRMFVFVCCRDCVGIFFCVAAVVKYSGVLSLGVLNYVVSLCKGFDGFCVFCLYCGAVGAREV